MPSRVIAPAGVKGVPSRVKAPAGKEVIVLAELKLPQDKWI